MVIFSRSLSQSLQQSTEDERFESIGVCTKLAHGYSRCSDLALKLEEFLMISSSKKLPHESSVKVLESCAQTFSYLVFQAIRMTENVNLVIKVTFPVVAWSNLSLSLTGLQNTDQNLVVSDHNYHHHLSPPHQSTWSVRVRYKPTKLKPE